MRYDGGSWLKLCAPPTSLGTDLHACCNGELLTLHWYVPLLWGVTVMACQAAITDAAVQRRSVPVMFDVSNMTNK